MLLDVPFPDDISVCRKYLRFEERRNIKDIMFLCLKFGREHMTNCEIKLLESVPSLQVRQASQPPSRAARDVVAGASLLCL